MAASQTNLFDLTGLTSLVTGAARGIGRGLAIGLAQHGSDIVVVDRVERADPVIDSIRALGRRAWYFTQDLSEIEQLDAFAGRVWQEAGRIDVLVNNAGIAYLEPFNQITPQHWRNLMAVNLDAVFFLSRAIAERMIANQVKGRIINISSNNGHVAEAGLAHYNASKGGVELLTQSLAIELGAHGITANTLCPGVIETDIREAFDIDIAAFDRYCREHIPLEHRYGTPEDLVGAAVFLASRAGAYMTGQHLVIDGGITCQQMPRLQFLPAYRNSIKR